MPRALSVGILATVFAVVLHQAAPAVGETSAKDVKQKTADAAEAIKDYTVDKKSEAVAQGKKLLRDLDAQVKQLETQASKATGEVRAKSKEDLKELKAKRAQASRKLDEFGKASADSWDSVKQGFVDAYKDLHRAYDKAVAQLK